MIQDESKSAIQEKERILTINEHGIKYGGRRVMDTIWKLNIMLAIVLVASVIITFFFNASLRGFVSATTTVGSILFDHDHS